MCTMVLEAVKVLISLAAHLAAIWLLLLHTHCAWIWYRGERVDDGERAVLVFFQLLVLVAVL